ncbi:hypothetical protein MMC07_003354 [Pseudocyphellaria aurata]|nr:hypothetical protein [Pseudocyphellaria aurata]
MAVILTGGGGKTALPIARFLQDAKIKFILASRRGPTAAPAGMEATKFDWDDPSTFENPFQHESLKGESVSAVYLVAPNDLLDPTETMNKFIDIAINKYGVKRFVLLASSLTEIGGHHTGKVWQHLVDTGSEYCVLRPTWFMENFLWVRTIRDEDKIYSACGEGKIPFVSAEDIGAAAYRGLTDEKPHNTSYYVVGPELLTYDQIAAIFSSVLGRHVVHVKISEEERAQKHQSEGMLEHVAKFLAWLEGRSAGGSEERLDDSVVKVTGRPPQTFDAWVQQNKATWQ